MTNNILLITKDAMCKEYLPIYGNMIWAGKTPNIDELAHKGTIFNRCYTAAPSTVMSFRSMMTGRFPYEQPYCNYTPKEVPESEEDFFSVARLKGYECHVLWDSTWVNMVLKYGNCFGKDTIIHNIEGIKQGVGCHYNRSVPIKRDDHLSRETIERIISVIKEILNSNNRILLWIHLPHVINGRTAYGGDIDIFDEFIGKCRGLFDDSNIFISADHGNMNGNKGKYCYGFDVYTSAIEIPLITPRIGDVGVSEEFISNVDFKHLILDRIINRREVIYSESAYYAQPHRKLAIIKKGLKYIYSKEKSREELYDIINDKHENCNLLVSNYKDPDRRLTSPTREYYYSPYWDSIDSIIRDFRDEKEKIWKNASWYKELYEKNLRRAKFVAVGLKKKIKKNS